MFTQCECVIRRVRVKRRDELFVLKLEKTLRRRVDKRDLIILPSVRHRVSIDELGDK